MIKTNPEIKNYHSLHFQWVEKLSITLFIVLFGVNLVSSKEKEINYLKNGVSFTLPGNWQTISDESLPNRSSYYSAESNEKNTSGLFTLVIINSLENPLKALLVQQRNMKEEEIYKTNGIEFTAVENSRFGSMEARKVKYEAVVKGIKVLGTVFCFNCSEKTFLIFLQTGLKDQKKNTKTFQLIELTFACR